MLRTLGLTLETYKRHCISIIDPNMQPDTIMFDLSKLLVPNANGTVIPCHDIVKGNVSKGNAVLECNCFTQVNRFPPKTAKQLVDPAAKGIMDQIADNRDAWISKMTLIHREMGPLNNAELEQQRQVFIKANGEAQKRNLKARCMLALLFPQQNFRGVKRYTELVDTWIEHSPNPKPIVIEHP